jgi:hypothetical protein
MAILYRDCTDGALTRARDDHENPWDHSESQGTQSPKWQSRPVQAWPSQRS